MDSQSSTTNEYDDEIDLRELFGVLWSGKIKIVMITAIFAVSSVFYALSIPNQYKATALLAPAQSDGGGLSSALGQLGGLASLAGVSIDGGGINELKIAQEVMKSWAFINDFIEYNDLAVEVAASNGWEQQSNILSIDQNIYSSSERKWVSDSGPPTSYDLYQAFLEKLSISVDGDGQLTEVSIEHYSPYVAKKWLDLYVSSINSYMQERKVDKVSRNIGYLNAQIEKTPLAEMQGVFYSVIEEQIKSKMLAEASPEYVFVTVGHSMVPEKKSKPQRSSIVILSTILGGVVAVFVVLFIYYYPSLRSWFSANGPREII